MFEDEVINVYTRKQAIEDGQLVDVSETSEAKEAGFKIPVCLTAGVHALVEVPESLKGLQDYKGRLWDTLFMATLGFRALKEKENNHCIPFQVVYQTAPRQIATVKLWLVFNEYEGFTIMLPHEY